MTQDQIINFPFRLSILNYFNYEYDFDYRFLVIDFKHFVYLEF